MPTSKVTGSEISHIWDDDSTTVYRMKIMDIEDFGPCVYFQSGDSAFNIYPESWDLIKDQIDSMMRDIEES